MIFAETGLLLGFFFPGDTLLFAAGLLAARGYFHIGLLLLVAIAAAVIGDGVGYYIGKRFGREVFVREDSLFFKKKSVDRAQAFFLKHGKITILLARYVPVVRTFAPVVAGVGDMPYRSFFTYNLAGGILWCCSIGLAGYFLGARIPNIDKYVLPIILLVFVFSFVPVIAEFISERRHSTK